VDGRGFLSGFASDGRVCLGAGSGIEGSAAGAALPLGDSALGRYVPTTPESTVLHECTIQISWPACAVSNLPVVT
jgi:hypothetical protein